MQFRLLGALEVRDHHGRVLTISGRQQRALLAMLLLNANQLVPTEHLIPELWAARAPSEARHSLHLLVHRLRRALAAGGVDVLRTEGAGYVLHADPDQIDALRFEALVGQARAASAAGRATEALATYDAALALWQGPALAEFADAGFAQPAIARLEELHVAARTDRAEVALSLGMHAELVPALEELVRRYPLQERLRYLLILALYRSGRQADALGAYQAARQQLVERLGIEPGQELQDLERAILNHDAALTVAPPRQADPAAAAPGQPAPAGPTRAGPAGPGQGPGAAPAQLAPPRPAPEYLSPAPGSPAQVSPAPGSAPPVAQGVTAQGVAPQEPTVQQTVAAGGGVLGPGLTERRVVTVLAVKVEGAGEPQRDPEELWTRRRLVAETLHRQVEQAGGVIIADVGHTVVAAFGADRAHRDDPVRAVTTALAVIRALQDAGSRTATAGVETGEAVVALPAGPGLPPQVTGEAANRAVELATLAPAGGVLAGAAAHRATGLAVEYRRTELAGGRGRAWRAIGVEETVEPAGATALSVIGRDRELAFLAEVLDPGPQDGTDPQPQLVTIVGAPGVGKTRLISELRRQVQGEPGEWLEGGSLPYGGGVTYWALAEIVKLSAGIETADSAGDAEHKLRAAVDAAFGDTAQAAWAAEYLTRLIHPRPGADEDAGWQREAFNAWRSYLEALAGERRLTLVFEDLHWADDDLLDFIEHLADNTAPVPLLVVCVAWPELLERRSGWGGGRPNVTTISLGPLSADSTELLLDALLDTAGPDVDLDPDQRALVLAGSGGNPLFVEEYVRMLRERDAGGREPESLVAPETLQVLIAARIDSLQPSDRALLADAAVLGELVWPDALAAVSGRGPADVEAAVARLTRREFLRRTRHASSPGKPVFAFRHVLIQQVAYGRLLRSHRAGRHRRAAEWLQALGGDRANDHAEVIAYHWREAATNARAASAPSADLEERAATALRRAGDRALGLAAYGAALRYYSQALDVWPDHLRGRLELVLSREELRLDLDFDADANLLAEAHDELLAAGDPTGAAMAKYMLARAAWVRGQPVDRLQDDTLSLLRTAPPSERKARVLAHLTHSLSLSGRHAATVRVGREADELAGTYGLRRLQAQALGFSGTSRAVLGDAAGIDDARRGVETLAELSSATSSPLSGLLSAARAHVGDLRGWAEQLAVSLELCDRFGAEGFRVWITIGRTGWLYPTGRWEEALEMAEHWIAQLQDAAGPAFLETVCRCVRGKILLGRGDLDGALADGAAAADFTRDADGMGFLMGAALRGHTLLAAGAGGDEPERLAAQAIDRLPGALLLPFVGVELPELLAATGHGPEVVDETLAHGSLWLQAMRAYLDGHPEQAADIYQRMDARADEAVARLRAARRLTAAGHPAEAADQASRARAFFERVSATHYLRQIERLGA